jgi:hypothetical protein
MLRLGSWLLCTYPAGGVAVGVAAGVLAASLSSVSVTPSRSRLHEHWLAEVVQMVRQ